MNLLPIADPVLIPTSNSSERLAATVAALSLNNIVNSHNEEQRNDRHALQIREAETPFLFGQDFDIEPEVWDQDYGDMWEL